MANNCKQCSIRIISHTTTPLPKAYDCVAVYIAGRRTSLVVYGWWPQPPTKNTWWRHQMGTFSALLALCAGNSPVNSPHKGQWRGALMFSFICVWINGWVINRMAGDLRRYRGHYDVILMICGPTKTTRATCRPRPCCSFVALSTLIGR